MARQLVVEAEARRRQNRLRCTPPVNSSQPTRSGAWVATSGRFAVDGLQGVTPEDVLDVGDQELLVLLLVVDAKGDDFAESCSFSSLASLQQVDGLPR